MCAHAVAGAGAGEDDGGKSETEIAGGKTCAREKKPAKPKKGKRGRRKPTVRALRLAAQVSDNAVTTATLDEAPVVTPPARPVPPPTEQPRQGGT